MARLMLSAAAILTASCPASALIVTDPSGDALARERVVSAARDDLHARLHAVSALAGRRMGHSFDDMDQVRLMARLVRTWAPLPHEGLRLGRPSGAGGGGGGEEGSGVVAVCEIGFDVGHGAATLLSALQALVPGHMPRDYIAFDTGFGVEAPVDDGLDMIRRHFEGVSFEGVPGPSGESVPAWVNATRAGRHAGCGIVHIDGAHDTEAVRADLTNALDHLAADGALVLLDDCECEMASWCAETLDRDAALGRASNCHRHWCVGPTRVFREFVAAGRLRPLHVWRGATRSRASLDLSGRISGVTLDAYKGMCAARFVARAGAASSAEARA